MIEKNNLRKLLKLLKGQIIDIEIEPKNPDDPRFIEACRAVNTRYNLVWLVKQVPVYQQESVGAPEINFVITIDQIKKIQFYPRLKSR